MTLVTIDTEAELLGLPDGTLITWLRIPGDDTSRAVAFVNVEVQPEVCQGGLHSDCTCERVVWVSPGGWDPKSPTEAGVTYPAHVVILGPLGDFIADRMATTNAASEAFDQGAISAQAMTPDLPELVAPAVFGELLTGGTYPRDEALRNAVALVAHQYHRSDDVETAVLPIAAVFARWLDGEPPTPGAEQ